MIGRHLESIIGNYRKILKEDGAVSKEQLLEMLKLDVYLPIGYQNKEGYDKLADMILHPEQNSWGQLGKRRMALYERGLTIRGIARKESVSVNAIRQWFMARGIKLEDRSAGTETVASN